MWTKFAATVAFPTMMIVAAPAHAQPNYPVFVQAIGADGIEMDPQQAILEGQQVCELMRSSDGASLWEAGQHVVSKHQGWGIALALKFANRAVQDICPHAGSF